MTMQRRHYELIAEIIRDLHNPEGSEPEAERAYIAHCFATALRSTNPNFNEARFLRACGVE